MMGLLWAGVGLVTWMVVVIAAQINPVLAEYNSDGRDMLAACRLLESELHPFTLFFLSLGAGPLLPLAVVIVAAWKAVRNC